MWLCKTHANPKKMCKQLFSLRWDFALKAWWPGAMRITWVGRKYLDKKGMTLQSLETYGYISSKTKSYQILRGFFLLFIFHAFWPYKASFPCFFAFWPYKVGLPCFFHQQTLLLITLFRPSLSGFSKFLDLFLNKPFYWEFLDLCPKADCIPTIPWIITKCLIIHLAASNFFHSNQINHPTRSMCRTLWRR